MEPKDKIEKMKNAGKPKVLEFGTPEYQEHYTNQMQNCLDVVRTLDKAPINPVEYLSRPMTEQVGLPYRIISIERYNQLIALEMSVKCPPRSNT